MRGFRSWVGSTVIVSADGFDVKGRLIAVRGALLVMRDAVALNGDVQATVDGTLLVPVGKVRYVQVP
ncbi:hypothetical protein U6G28_02585 [Actinomycetaceae bacterium MB13-C1-2]|nr:hypothetical protein U6G28_02585 [Actinomycetaceae bacterium MB13-C1-2]